MTQFLNPFSGRQFLDANGAPYVGAQLFVYQAGTSTKQTVTKDKAGASNHANPIILNARGEPADGSGASMPIWQPSDVDVKLVLAPSTDSDPPVSPISTWDNLAGINDAIDLTASQWIAGTTPTYVSATEFSVAGDQRTTYHVGRRVYTVNSGGNRFGWITSVSYSSSTLVEVAVDSGSFDSGMSAVYYSILTADNHALPDIGVSIVRYKNLYAVNNTTNPLYQIDITADEIIVKDQYGKSKLLSSFSATVDITASGANGLDTGAEANDKWYYYFAISKTDGTESGLLSASSTSPTLPAEYRYFTLLGAVYNNSSGNFRLFRQVNNGCYYDSFHTFASALWNVTTTEITSSLAPYVPPIAQKWSGYNTFRIQLSSWAAPDFIFYSPVLKLYVENGILSHYSNAHISMFVGTGESTPAGTTNIYKTSSLDGIRHGSTIYYSNAVEADHYGSTTHSASCYLNCLSFEL